MPRAAKSRIQVEIEAQKGLWSLFKGGFKSMPDAEAWIKTNIPDGLSMRVVRVSGIFSKKVTIVKR